MEVQIKVLFKEGENHVCLKTREKRKGRKGGNEFNGEKEGFFTCIPYDTGDRWEQKLMIGVKKDISVGFNFL